MKLKEIMTRNVEAISADSNLVAAAIQMARQDIGFLPVFDNKIVGVVTDRDIVVRAVAEGRNPSEVKVADVMTSDVAVLSQDQEVEVAAKLMQERKIRRVLIQDTDNQCVGVVSLGDLATGTSDSDLSGHALEKVCAD